MNESLKQYCWSVGFDKEFEDGMKPFAMPRLKQALSFVPLSIRLLHFFCFNNLI
jgi:hypothetical protein